MSKGRILVVDDTIESLKLLTNILAVEGYEVRPANSGELALASVKYTEPELVLLDIRMPEMDGFEVFRRLREAEETQNIPVMFISASSDMQDQIKGLTLGAVDFVSKPYQNEVVLARVKTHLELYRLRNKLQEEVNDRTSELSMALDMLENEFAERKKAEEERQSFYRETIFSATDGKLTICDDDHLKQFVMISEIKSRVAGFASLGDIRSSVKEFCKSHGVDEEQLNDLILGFGEILDNAVKHCGAGRMFAGANEASVWVGVSDDGPGIDSLILPKATLRKRFSTKVSMGLGYSVVLQIADQVLLSTSKSGTTVVLIKNLKKEDPLTLDDFPDTWDAIQDCAIEM